MVQINDNDAPIITAGKIIFATKEDLTDMFSVEEIKEIASYLMLYYMYHEKGD